MWILSYCINTKACLYNLSSLIYSLKYTPWTFITCLIIHCYPTQLFGIPQDQTSPTMRTHTNCLEPMLYLKHFDLIKISWKTSRILKILTWSAKVVTYNRIAILLHPTKYWRTRVPPWVSSTRQVFEVWYKVSRARAEIYKTWSRVTRDRVKLQVKARS